ncbi:MAG: thioredoxin domain-containing protein [Candidatus Nitrosotenuis sp.]
MAKHYLAVPIIIGIVAGIFSVASFSNPQNKQGDFMMSQILKVSSPHNGNPSAQITIIEFGDYQCTFCCKFHASSLDIKGENILTPEKQA